MGREIGDLFVLGAVAVVEIIAGLANADDLGMLRHLDQLGGRDVGIVLGVVWVRADRGPDIVVLLRDFHHRVEVSDVAAYVDHMRHAGVGRARDDLGAIVVEFLAVQIDVAVDHAALTLEMRSNMAAVLSRLMPVSAARVSCASSASLIQLCGDFSALIGS